MRLAWSPLLDAIDLASLGRSERLYSILATIAPTYPDGDPDTVRFRAEAHQLDDGPTANATNEIIAIALGCELASKVGKIAVPLPAVASLGLFDRKALSANWRRCDPELRTRDPGILEHEATKAISVKELDDLDFVARVLACTARPLPARYFSNAELAFANADFITHPLNSELWVAPRAYALRSPFDNSPVARRTLRDLDDRLHERPSDGLRRLCLLPLIVDDAGALLARFDEAFVALSGVWQDSYFFDYCLGLANCATVEHFAADHGRFAMMLARSSHSRALVERALPVLERFQPLDLVAPQRAKVAVELANVFAQSKDPRALHHAELLIEAGVEQSFDDRVTLARLFNVLGLIRYRQGRDQEAMALERDAVDLATAADPDAKAWSGTALLPNMAKLEEFRFENRSEALRLYLEGAEQELGLSSIRSRLQAARILIGDHQWRRALDLLSAVAKQEWIASGERVLIALMEASAYSGLGDTRSALASLRDAERILSRFPTNELSERVHGLIAELDGP